MSNDKQTPRVGLGGLGERTRLSGQTTTGPRVNTTGTANTSTANTSTGGGNTKTVIAALLSVTDAVSKGVEEGILNLKTDVDNKVGRAGDETIDGEKTFIKKLTAATSVTVTDGPVLTTSGISNAEAITGVTSFTAANDLDIGTWGFKANTLTAATMTPTRVAFYGAGGLLSHDSRLTFSDDTLTATKVVGSTSIGVTSGPQVSSAGIGDAKAISGATTIVAATSVTVTDGPSLTTSGISNAEVIGGVTSLAVTSGPVLDSSGITKAGAIAGATTIVAATSVTVTDGPVLTTSGISNAEAIAGVTSFTAANDLDIGTHGFTAKTLTADTMTPKGVAFYGTGGLLSYDSDLTFDTDTLTATKIGAFEATGAINFGSQAMTNVDINSGTIDGISSLTATKVVGSTSIGVTSGPQVSSAGIGDAKAISGATTIVAATSVTVTDGPVLTTSGISNAEAIGGVTSLTVTSGPVLDSSGISIKNNNKIRVSSSTNELEFTNDGSTWNLFGSGTGGGLWDTVDNNINYPTGKVGIKTATPEYDLDVTGSARVSGNIFIGSMNVLEILESIPSIITTLVLVEDSITSTEVKFETSANALGKVYWILLNSGVTPTPEQIINGYDSTDVPLIANNISTNLQTISTSSFRRLESNKSYTIWAISKDLYNHRSFVSINSTFRTLTPTAYVSPPIVRTITTSKIVLTSNVVGQIYWIVLAEHHTASDTEIKDTATNTGSPIATWVTRGVATISQIDVENTITATGLSGGVAYKFLYVVEDKYDNLGAKNESPFNTLNPPIITTAQVNTVSKNVVTYTVGAKYGGTIYGIVVPRSAPRPPHSPLWVNLSPPLSSNWDNTVSTVNAHASVTLTTGSTGAITFTDLADNTPFDVYFISWAQTSQGAPDDSLGTSVSGPYYVTTLLAAKLTNVSTIIPGPYSATITFTPNYPTVYAAISIQGYTPWSNLSLYEQLKKFDNNMQDSTNTAQRDARIADGGEWLPKYATGGTNEGRVTWIKWTNLYPGPSYPKTIGMGLNDSEASNQTGNRIYNLRAGTAYTLYLICINTNSSPDPDISSMTMQNFQTVQEPYVQNLNTMYQSVSNFLLSGDSIYSNYIIWGTYKPDYYEASNTPGDITKSESQGGNLWKDVFSIQGYYMQRYNRVYSYHGDKWHGTQHGLTDQGSSTPVQWSGTNSSSPPLSIDSNYTIYILPGVSIPGISMSNTYIMRDHVQTTSYTHSSSSWEILMYTAADKVNSAGADANFGSLGHSQWRNATASTSGASGRTAFGDGAGLYNAFFNKTNITKIAMVSGTGDLSNPSSNTKYIIYNLTHSTGSNSIYELLKKIDTANLGMPSARLGLSETGDGSLKNSASSIYKTSLYSGVAPLGQHNGQYLDNTGVVPDKFCIWGVNQDGDWDTQVLCAYSGNLLSGKGDGWRGGAPAQTAWSYWGNDWYRSPSQDTISVGSQTYPGYSGNNANDHPVYLIAFDDNSIDAGFTGQHYNIPRYILNPDKDIGKTVISTGSVDNIKMDQAYSTVELSDKEYDKRVYGVISQIEDGGNKIVINSLGEGAILVCNKNGNIENGDFLTTSIIQGYAMKQNDDILKNITVGKATMDCDFTGEKMYYITDKGDELLDKFFNMRQIGPYSYESLQMYVKIARDNNISLTGKPHQELYNELSDWNRDTYPYIDRHIDLLGKDKYTLTELQVIAVENNITSTDDIDALYTMISDWSNPLYSDTSIPHATNVLNTVDSYNIDQLKTIALSCKIDPDAKSAKQLYVDFENWADPDIIYPDIFYKAELIACTYHCG